MTTAYFKLRRLIKNGDDPAIQTLLNEHGHELDVNEYDINGFTPLMLAVMNHQASVEIVRALISYGADVHQISREHYSADTGVLGFALKSGDLQKVQILLDHGADLHYVRDGGYGAVVDLATGFAGSNGSALIDLLKLLIANKTDLNRVTDYRESGLRVLSRIGRFDAVKILLDAGADETQLKWTPLIKAVAIGSLADVKTAADGLEYFEEVDCWSRTALLVAIQIGDISKAQFLLECGADLTASGRGDKPSLFYAIDSGHPPMLEWLLAKGISPKLTDKYGDTPLIHAAKHSSVEAAKILLNAGVEVNHRPQCGSALEQCINRQIVMLLLEAGGDPQDLSFEGRRALLGFDQDWETALERLTVDDFHRGRTPRFGESNPEKIEDPFWEGMIRAGINAASATHWFLGDFNSNVCPVWCAQRFGQSLTFLDDGRIIQIAGEHEDHYDPDFYIYNDVFVHEPDGKISVFGYPKEVFPPTDFHTATLIGDQIYIIGSLGYWGTRKYGETPIYRLDVNTYVIDKIETTGEAPGWIYKHRATLLSEHEISIFGGKIVTFDNEREIHTDNEKTFLFDVRRRAWL